MPTRTGYGVYVVENSTARWRRVRIGLRQPGMVEISAGLRPGETVVRAGHLSVADGSRIQVAGQGQKKAD